MGRHAYVGDVLESLSSDERLRGLWAGLAQAFARALEQGDDGELLDLLHEQARLEGASTELQLGAVLDELSVGLERLGDSLIAGGEPWIRLQALAVSCMRSAGLGYNAGMRERLEEFEAALAAVGGSATGVLSPEALRAHLALESLRCQRMELPLGLAGVVAAPRRPCARGKSSAGVGSVLRGNLRPYDEVGSLGEGELVIVLPDVARSGLLAAVERLHRRLLEDPRTSEMSCWFTLAHLDCADTLVGEMLDLVSEDRTLASERGDYVRWA